MNYQIKAILSGNQEALLEPIFKYSVDARHSGEYYEQQYPDVTDFEVVHTARPPTHTYLTGIGPLTLRRYREILAERDRT